MCEYCENEKLIGESEYTNVYCGPGPFIHVYVGFCVMDQAVSDYAICKTRYCPMCGRDLRKEATDG